MIIRKARTEDKNTVVDLIIEAIEDLSNTFTGCEDNSMAKQKLKDFYCLPKNRFSYEYCFTAEIDGQVAGSIIAYPGKEMNELNKPLIEQLKEKFKHDKKIFHKYEKDILESREAFDDEYYIDNLAVLQNFRGNGIAKKLICQIEENALIKGYKKISILADIHNNRAFSIYQKLGYIKDCELDVLGHTYHHLVKEI